MKPDEEYLDEKFPKHKTKFRGEAMVLLALARQEGQQIAHDDIKELTRIADLRGDLVSDLKVKLRNAHTEEVEFLKGLENNRKLGFLGKKEYVVEIVKRIKTLEGKKK